MGEKNRLPLGLSDCNPSRSNSLLLCELQHHGMFHVVTVLLSIIIRNGISTKSATIYHSQGLLTFHDDTDDTFIQLASYHHFSSQLCTHPSSILKSMLINTRVQTRRTRRQSRRIKIRRFKLMFLLSMLLHRNRLDRILRRGRHCQ